MCSEYSQADDFQEDDDEDLSTEQSECEIISSIAMANTALARILCAESDKIRRAVRCTKDIRILLEVNRSVNKTITNTLLLEQMFYHQLDMICDIKERKRKEPIRPERPKREHPCPNDCGEPRDRHPCHTRPPKLQLPVCPKPQPPCRPKNC